MSVANTKERRRPQARPFPWTCANCGKSAVVPTPVDYRARVKHDGAIREFIVPRLTIPRWLIQSSRMNKRLRMFFAFPEAREMLRRLDREPELGMEVILPSANRETNMPTDESAFKPVAILAFRFYHSARELGLVDEMDRVRRHAFSGACDDYPLPQSVFEEDKPTEPPLPIARFAEIWNQVEREAKAEEEDWGEAVDAILSSNGRSKAYKDGTPNLDVRVPRNRARPLPFRIDKSVSIRLRIGRTEYRAKLSSTRGSAYVWIKPDLIGPEGKEYKLGRILTEASFKPNERVRLIVAGSLIAVHKRD